MSVFVLWSYYTPYWKGGTFLRGYLLMLHHSLKQIGWKMKSGRWKNYYSAGQRVPFKKSDRTITTEVTVRIKMMDWGKTLPKTNQDILPSWLHKTVKRPLFSVYRIMISLLVGQLSGCQSQTDYLLLDWSAHNIEFDWASLLSYMMMLYIYIYICSSCKQERGA